MMRPGTWNTMLTFSAVRTPSRAASMRFVSSRIGSSQARFASVVPPTTLADGKNHDRLGLHGHEAYVRGFP
jgi:hypothetical protein